MKKIFSLVALAGMFALMSFSFKTNEFTGLEQNLPVNCYEQSAEVVSFWNSHLEGYTTLTSSQQFAIFMTTYDLCTAGN